MSDFYLGEIRAFSGDWVPPGWQLCDGRTLKIQQYSALYALIGIKFGGDGKATFGLPDLRGHFVAGVGVSQALGTTFTMGQNASAEAVKLTDPNQIPAHVHSGTFAVQPPASPLSVTVADTYGGQASPKDNLLARSGSSPSALANTYATARSGSDQLGGISASGGTLAGGTVALATAGGGPVPVMSPYLAITYMISTTGLWPSRP